MADAPRIHAVLAEFNEPEPLLAAARRLHEDGWRIETFTPFPIDGLGEAIGFTESKVPLATLIGGVIGLIAGFLMQAVPNLLYPLDVGGRPLIAVPAFTLVTLEIGVLCAVFAGILTMLIANRLPRLHHPLFNAERFGLASDDRFFLAVLPREEDFDHREARAALWRLQAIEVTDVCEEQTG